MSSSKYFAWPTTEVRLAEFAATAPLPAIILLSTVNCGETGVEGIKADEVIRVHCKATWTRVKARDEFNRWYSIAVDHPAPFRDLSKGRTVKPLKTVLAKAKYPLKVQMVPPLGSKTSEHVMTGVLEIKRPEDTYEETFLKGNNIVGGHLKQQIIMIPNNLHIQVKVAHKTALHDQLSVEASTMDFNQTVPLLPITEHSEDIGEEETSDGYEVPRNLNKPDHLYVPLAVNQQTPAKSTATRAKTKDPPKRVEFKNSDQRQRTSETASLSLGYEDHRQRGNRPQPQVREQPAYNASRAPMFYEDRSYSSHARTPRQGQPPPPPESNVYEEIPYDTLPRRNVPATRGGYRPGPGPRYGQPPVVPGRRSSWQ